VTKDIMNLLSEM